MANDASDDISLLFGDGEGDFSATTTVAVGDAPQAVAMVDLDVDGDLDLVVANLFSDNVSILHNHRVP